MRSRCQYVLNQMSDAVAGKNRSPGAGITNLRLYVRKQRRDCRMAAG
jgi:hypothetical protein